MKILFNTPLDENKWINNWLKENKVSIAMYNFATDTGSSAKTIEKAASAVRGVHSDKMMEIPLINKAYYTSGIAIDAESDIVSLILQHENRKNFIAFLENENISFKTGLEGNIVITSKNNDITITSPEIIPEGTVFEHDGDLILKDFNDRTPVKDVRFSAYDLPRALAYGITFKHEGSLFILEDEDKNDYIQTLGGDIVFENDGDVQIEGLHKIYGNPIFKSTGEVDLPDLTVLEGHPEFRMEGDLILGHNLTVGKDVIITGNVVIEENITIPSVLHGNSDAENAIQSPKAP